jgi:hypothetical protein
MMIIPSLKSCMWKWCMGNLPLAFAGIIGPLAKTMHWSIVHVVAPRRVSKQTQTNGNLRRTSCWYHRSLSKDNALKRCPCCGTEDETTTSFWQCADNKFWKSRLEEFLCDFSAACNPLRCLQVTGFHH